jgi:MFS family permease
LKDARQRQRTLINGYFLLEGLNSFGTTIYFFYIYFFTERVFGFTKVQNFLLAASIGLIYGVASMVGGKVAQRRGYLFALSVGCGIMALMLMTGAFVDSLAVHLVIAWVSAAGMALTWPGLEALVSEGDTPEHLPRNIGIYNLVWAAFGALAYFVGGAMVKAWTFRAMFLVPVVIFVAEIVIACLLERARKSLPRLQSAPTIAAALDDEDERQRSPIAPEAFLKMAWVANPFAYLAINTVLAAVPSLANRLGLTLAAAGAVCSLWQFVRAGSFVLLWQWKGWHYRFRWLIAAYVALAAGFFSIQAAPNLAVLLFAQVLFGLSTGLIYYSSLYYSMHVGEAKGEHGGVHEAMIGVGSFAGPAVSAASLHLLPNHASSGALAVATVLLGGLGMLVWLGYSKRSPRRRVQPSTTNP